MKNLIKLQIINILQKIIKLYQELLAKKKEVNSHEFIILHHEANSNGFYGVDNWHRQLWRFKSELGHYIGYQYYIDKTGKLWQGRKNTEEGAHAKGWNKKSIGICMEGNLQRYNMFRGQSKTLRELLDRLRIKYSIPKSKVLAHKEVGQTLCPGQHGISWLNKYRS